MNLQNIPSKEKAIRMMFKATSGEYEVPIMNDTYKIIKWDQIQTSCGWKRGMDLKSGDILASGEKIVSVSSDDGLYLSITVQHQEGDDEGCENTHC